MCFSLCFSMKREEREKCRSSEGKGKFFGLHGYGHIDRVDRVLGIKFARSSDGR